MQQFRSAAALNEALDHLAREDADLARAMTLAGRPRLRSAKPGFRGLVTTLISQQVSVAAARAIEGRLEAAIDDITPRAILDLDPPVAKACGLSGQKYRYLQELASAIESGSLRLNRLSRAPDDEVYDALTAIKGIGPWTANIYLMFSLRRCDSFAAGDLALQEGYRRLRGLDQRPTSVDLERYSEAWRPYRAAAALILWRYYSHGFSPMG